MTGLVVVLLVLAVAVGCLFWKGAGRNRHDPEGHLTPLDYFDTPIPTNRAARRARE